MIRRELMFADGVKRWLLISQIEHARLSGVLAEKCIAKFGGGGPSLDSVRQELVAAIAHHDDGWHEWELAPRLDPKLGRPLSFMELAPADAIDVWDRSIQAASEIGELAAWTVSGHFSALGAILGGRAHKEPARSWLREMAVRRSEWFGRWRAGHETIHTAELAGEALKWLQLFDVLSLWPCSQYRLADEQAARLPEPFRTAQNWTLVREIRPSTQQTASVPCQIVLDPWPFVECEFAIQAAAHLVVARHYSSADELLAAREPFMAEWMFTSAG
jgi:hypothetical protein